MTATPGALVTYYEDANSVPAPVPAWVIMTADSWDQAAADALGEGNYPRQPAAGEVLLGYWACAGNQLGAPASQYATSGTGIGQYQ